MRNLIIFGTGEIADVAHYYFDKGNEYKVIGFAANREFITAQTFHNLPIFAVEEIIKSNPPGTCDIFVALSYQKMNLLRKRIFQLFLEYGYSFASYVSERAVILNDYNIGKNAFILEHNTIQPYVKIGNNVTLWSGNHIGHHSVIEDHVFISSHVVVSGGVTLGSESFVGVNATFRDHIKVGKSNLIGAGSLIMKSTLDKAVYVADSTKPAAFDSDRFSV